MSSTWANAAAGNKTGANNANTNSNPKAEHISRTSESPLEDFLRRTNNAGLHAQEPANTNKDDEEASLAEPVSKSHAAQEPTNKTKEDEEEDWELIDATEAQDKDEWTLISKTAAEKAELEKRIAEQNERRVKRLRKR